VIVAIDEDFASRVDLGQSLRVALGEEGAEVVRVCFAGDEASMADCVAALGVGAVPVVYLGPMIEDLVPLWWWAWAVHGALECDDSVGIVWPHGDGFSAGSAGGAACDAGGVIWSWRQCREALDDYPIGLGAGLRALSEAVKSALGPSIAGEVIGEVERWCMGAADFRVAAIAEPNRVSWHLGVSEGSRLPVTGFVGLAQVRQMADMCHEIDGRRGIECGGRSAATVVRLANEIGGRCLSSTERWINAMLLWSALFCVRGDVCRSSGLSCDAFMNYWRSYECYLYRLGLQEGLLRVGDEGQWSWASGSVYGPVCVAVIVEELGRVGMNFVPIGIGRGGRRRKEFRWLRNRCLLGHGFAGCDDECLERAKDVLVLSILGVEGSAHGGRMPRWARMWLCCSVWG